MIIEGVSVHLTDLSPKSVAIASLSTTVAAMVPWVAITSMLADTTWPDVAKEFIALLYMVGSGYLLIINRRDTSAAKAEASAVKTQTQRIRTKLRTVDKKVDEAAHAAKTAARVAKDSDEKAEGDRLILAEVASHTNGEFAKVQKERDELWRRVEAMLKDQLPPAVEPIIARVAKTVELIAEKSGVIKLHRDPNARERATDKE